MHHTTKATKATIVLRCQHGSVFHLGIAGGNMNASLATSEAYIRSDRLFSALTATIARIYPHHVNTFVQAVQTGAIAFSSAFFCLEKAGQYRWFLPVPASCRATHTNNHKAVKAVQWVSAGVYQKGIGPEAWVANTKNDGVAWLNPSAICLPNEARLFGLPLRATHLYHDMLQPHVQRHTNSLADRLYQMAGVCLQAPVPGVQTHYYFLYNSHAGSALDGKVQAALRIIGDEGLGGERSNGCGRYNGIDVLPGHQPLTPVPQSNFAMGLSLVNPAPHELAAATLYQTEKRGGRPIEAGGRLKTIYMLCEGALYNLKQQPQANQPAGTIQGQLVNLAPYPKAGPHLRNGKAFCIPLHPNYAPTP